MIDSSSEFYVEANFLAVAIFALFVGLYGTSRYKTLLNPLVFFAWLKIIVYSLMSGMVAYNLLPFAEYTEEDLVFTVWITAIFLLGAFTVYFIPINLMKRVTQKLFSLLSLNVKPRKFNFIKFGFVILFSFIVFALMAFLGGGGSLWLTDSRTAYISNRAGVGIFFALSYWLLLFAYLYYLWTYRPSFFKLVGAVIFFGSLASFLGSKNLILIFGVVAFVYYEFFIKRVRLVVYILFAPLMLVMFGLLLFTQNRADLNTVEIFDVFKYFKDYFDTTTQFISRFDEFGYLYGQGMLSTLWHYVPRGLFPNKPYEYDALLIHKVLFPDMAELGHTPGLLPWSLAYLDFGVVGVYLHGFGISLLQRTTYEYFFFGDRNNFFAFFFMIHFSLWPIMSYSTTIMVLIFSALLSIYLRLCWVSPKTQARVSR